MEREELIKMVALKMDEISSSNDVIVQVLESDNNPLYTLIDSLLDESVNDMLMKAPLYRLYNHTGTAASSRPTTVNSIKVGIINVPTDFLRFASIEDKAFKRPIVTLAVEGDEVDKRQHNKHLVAKKAKPVAVIGNDATKGRIITCYSYGIADTPSPTMLYVKRYDGNATLDEYQTDIVTWVCAGKVFAAQGDVNKGQLCDNNASALMV
jgi:hypothetical protein